MERRKAQRYELAVPIRLSSRKNRDAAIAVNPLISKNISSRGVYLYTEEPFTEHSDVRVKIYLTFRKLHRLCGVKWFLQVELKGTVVRVECHGAAVRFRKRYRFLSIQSHSSDLMWSVSQN